MKTTGSVIVLVGECLLNGKGLYAKGKVQVQVRVPQHHDERREATSKYAEQFQKILYSRKREVQKEKHDKL